MNKIKLLAHDAIQARIKRMAYEIYEKNYEEEGLLIIGVDYRGGYLGRQLAQHLKQISPLKVELASAALDREDRQGRPGRIEASFSVALDALKDRVVVVADDVLFSGNTLFNVVSPLMQATPRKIQIAVLIDRGHRFMPMSPNFVGMDVATTIHQHVSVEISEDQQQIEVFLV